MIEDQRVEVMTKCLTFCIEHNVDQERTAAALDYLEEAEDMPTIGFYQRLLDIA